jgi:hypothetical protein
MFKLVGTPDLNDLRNIQSDRARKFIQNMEHIDPIDFKELIPSASPEALDLL